MAGLFPLSAWVSVCPPLSARGESCALTPLMSPGPASEHVAVLTMV